jgi:hypothetical protein
MSNDAPIPGLPAEAVPLVRKLLEEELLPVEALRSELRAHVARIEDAAAQGDLLDTSLAQSLATACATLIDRTSGLVAEQERKLVQVAVRYFVLDDDAEPDLDGILGLDDDAAVLNSVLRKLGHDDLIVAV